MIRIPLRRFAALFLVLVLLDPNQVAQAHTGYPPVPIFTFTSHPDFPMEDFVAGHLGVVLPSYDPRFLYAAYRNLTGAKFTSAEILTMKESWEALLNNRYKNSILYKRHETSWREKWFYLRLRASNDALSRESIEKQISSEYYLHDGGGYVFFENCAEDAFRNAISTLKARQHSFGRRSSQVQAWLAAQDQVFANCSDKSVHGMPTPAPDNAPLIARQDRVYQIAAAHFYRGDYDDARVRFEAIANDEASPWRSIASYLVGRTLLRKAQFKAPKGQEFDAKSLEAAAAAFRSVIADKTRREWHEPAANLLEFIEIRQSPAAACSRLATTLTKRNSLSGSAQPLTDYLYLLDEHREDSSLSPNICAGNDDLSDWLHTFSGSPEKNFRHAYEKWQQTRSLPWLVTSLVQAAPSNPQSEELLSAAANVPHASPAYWTVCFHRERLLAEKGRLDLARRELDDDLAPSDGTANPLNPSSKNLFLALRARIAANLDDFLRFAVRTPSALIYLDEYNTKLADDEKDPRDAYMRQAYAGPHLDDDAGAVINNHLSLLQLSKVAQSDALPLNVRRDVTLMAFTRAIVTENSTLADQIAQAAASIAPDATQDLSTFLAASNKQEKNFAAIWLILHHPEMQPAVETGATRATAAGKIDSFQNNWWAHFRFESPEDENDPESLYCLHWWNRLPNHLKPVFPEGEIPPPAFLSEADLLSTRNDWRKLETLPLAGDWLASRTLQFARSNPEDPRIPEALHLAVRATRFGGTDAHTPNYSKQAYQLLHKKYPNNEWTKKTPYWF